MSNIIKLGMVFDESTAPDFGSISISKQNTDNYTLLAADISKLNSILTRANLTPLISQGGFNVPNGALALVTNYKTAESAKAYMYEVTSDTWYEWASAASGPIPIIADRLLYIEGTDGQDYAGLLRSESGKPVFEYDAVLAEGGNQDE